MKTTAIIFAFFLEYFLLETRDALPMNGLEDLTRGQTISRGHLPLYREISHRARAKLRKQTASKTEDMSGSNAGARFVTTLFHGTVSGETNLRKFLKVLSKVSCLPLLDPFLLIYEENNEPWSASNSCLITQLCTNKFPWHVSLVMRMEA